MSPPKHHLSGKAPAEKSRFVQTCNRLSLFLKEKGNIRNLNLGINATAGIAETIDLLSNINEKTSQVASIDLPQYVILDSSRNKAEHKAAQMTIFYEGQVLVLDDVPADRARELMLIAKNGIQSKSKEAAEVEGKDSDLPIARRASLHKFLAKRKDRATVRPPFLSPSGNEHTFDLNM